MLYFIRGLRFPVPRSSAFEKNGLLGGIKAEGLLFYGVRHKRRMLERLHIFPFKLRARKQRAVKLRIVLAKFYPTYKVHCI
jgi:hypothetical protein